LKLPEQEFNITLINMLWVLMEKLKIQEQMGNRWVFFKKESQELLAWAGFELKSS
jgi:hypothetical protein